MSRRFGRRSNPGGTDLHLAAISSHLKDSDWHSYTFINQHVMGVLALERELLSRFGGTSGQILPELDWSLSEPPLGDEIWL